MIGAPFDKTVGLIFTTEFGQLSTTIRQHQLAHRQSTLLEIK